MVKKKIAFEPEDDDNILLGKKAKRKLAKAQQLQSRQQTSKGQDSPSDSAAASTPADDVMSRIALLCQSQKWREAVLLCRSAIRKQEENGTPDNALGVQMAMKKIEKSLRRQMVAAFMNGSKELLRKEYLLDVGE